MGTAASGPDAYAERQTLKILVTGATGFIGSHVVAHLSSLGHVVLAGSRQPSKVPALYALPGAIPVELELARREGWAELLAGCDAVVHVALGWGDTGPAMLEADTAATVALLEAARLAGVGAFVYTSSTAACGPMDPHTAETRAPRPADLYGATKAASEMFARAYAATGSMKVHVVRPGYIFGEPVVEGARSQPDGRFAAICRAVREGVPVRLIRHDGTQFLAVTDLVRVYAALLGHEHPFSLHQALSKEWRSWEEIARMAMEEAGREVEIEAQDLGWGAEPHLFGVTAMELDLGFSFGNVESLRRHVRWQLARG